MTRGTHFSGPVVSKEGLSIGTEDSNTAIVDKDRNLTVADISGSKVTSTTLILTPSTANKAGIAAATTVPAGKYVLAVTSTGAIAWMTTAGLIGTAAAT